MSYRLDTTVGGSLRVKRRQHVTDDPKRTRDYCCLRATSQGENGVATLGALPEARAYGPDRLQA